MKTKGAGSEGGGVVLVCTHRLVKRLWLRGAHVQMGHHGLESLALFRQLLNTHTKADIGVKNTSFINS